MGDITHVRGLINGIPETIDLTIVGNVLNADNFKITSSGVAASKPLKTDADKKLTAGDIVLTSEVSGILPVANGGTNSGTALNNNRIMKTVGGAIIEHDAITADRALISNANGIPVQSDITKTELEALDNVTGNIQAQINAMQTGLARRTKVDQIVADPSTTFPGTGLPAAASGQRYIVQAAVAANNANWGGDNDAFAEDDIVQHNGTKWVVSHSPTEGSVTYVDSVNKDALYVDDGTPEWELRNVQSTALTDGTFWIGNSSDESQERTMGGEASMTNAGVVTLSNAAVIAKLLTGFTAGAGYETVEATDSILAALQKIVGNFTNNLPTDFKFKATAGEELAINKTYPVRYALDGETAGRIYIATKDHENSADKFWAIGVVQVAGTLVSAGDEVEVVKLGEITLKSGDVNPIQTDQGKPVFLGKNGGSQGLIKTGDPADDDVTVDEKFASVMVGSVLSRSAIVTETKLWIDCGPGSFQGIGIKE